MFLSIKRSFTISHNFFLFKVTFSCEFWRQNFERNEVVIHFPVDTTLSVGHKLGFPNCRHVPSSTLKPVCEVDFDSKFESSVWICWYCCCVDVAGDVVPHLRSFRLVGTEVVVSIVLELIQHHLHPVGVILIFAVGMSSFGITSLNVKLWLKIITA